jgi:cytochrome c556
MRSLTIALGSALIGLAAVSLTQAQENKDLPEGPIRERHELMESVGRNARIIGEAMKAGDIDKVSGPATLIALAAKKMAPLFPAGSEHPKSRAKPDVWEEPDVFAAEIKTLEDRAAALATAADERTGVPEAANELFASCKSCHTKFRLPED